jgi:hypothetical protein
MFEGLEPRARRAAERRAKARAAELAQQMGELLPRGISAEAVDGGVAVSGRGIRRRWLLEPALRWMIGELK